MSQRRFEILLVRAQTDEPGHLFDGFAEIEGNLLHFKFACFDLGKIENVVQNGQ